MTTSEPTTGEIVRALRCIADDIECKDCRYKYPVGNVILCDHERMNGNAADRLESQEREIERLKTAMTVAKNIIANRTDELSGITGELERMTASAEQAETREKAVLDDVRDYCQFCAYSEIEEDEEPCKTCENVTHDGRESKWTRRGLPQDGEGK